ncbi:hypothetical protein [Iningainema tapete]|uniref:Uncharacterized protein n=1 Tax=Iningainema tapete BLCC-T55 TaxID=2748662 RepID=A0A8J6XIE3_9CYAN|nr:hypothetical protein [Iningainema tapete]MBD2773845.1 hypothetical protein [Iningainema tapete BLCC-T55]
MDTTSKFHIKIHPQVKKQDLPELSQEMQDDFWQVFIPILEIDPYSCCGFSSHDLVRELKGWRALEIEREVEGYEEVYRLVYQITDTLKNKSVEIISFGLHDPAYDKAYERVGGRGRR